MWRRLFRNSSGYNDFVRAEPERQPTHRSSRKKSSSHSKKSSSKKKSSSTRKRVRPARQRRRKKTTRTLTNKLHSPIITPAQMRDGRGSGFRARNHGGDVDGAGGCRESPELSPNSSRARVNASSSPAKATTPATPSSPRAGSQRWAGRSRPASSFAEKELSPLTSKKLRS